MPRTELAPELLDDFDRIIAHLRVHEVHDVASRILEIISAIDVLQHNPRIGRIVEARARELIIGRDSRGYVALYRHVAEIDAAIVLAIRIQREAGYACS